MAMSPARLGTKDDTADEDYPIEPSIPFQIVYPQIITYFDAI
jgi:hypothetical protein